MSKVTESFLEDLDVQIQVKHLLNHKFYIAWSKGELSRECLKEYSKEYYHHVKAFPTYLSALHSHTDDIHTRQIILKNLIEEEAGSPNHPELWRSFALAIGVTEEELTAHKPNAQIRHLMTTFRKICADQSVAEGVAALYAYESQIPAICLSKIKGLKEYYGMKSAKEWEYFHVHIAADEEHAAQEKRLLEMYVTPGNVEKIRASVQQVLDALWNFLSGLCVRHHITC